MGTTYGPFQLHIFILEVLKRSFAWFTCRGYVGLDGIGINMIIHHCKQYIWQKTRKSIKNPSWYRGSDQYRLHFLNLWHLYIYSSLAGCDKVAETAPRTQGLSGSIIFFYPHLQVQLIPPRYLGALDWIWQEQAIRNALHTKSWLLIGSRATSESNISLLKSTEGQRRRLRIPPQFIFTNICKRRQKTLH